MPLQGSGQCIDCGRAHAVYCLIFLLVVSLLMLTGSLRMGEHYNARSPTSCLSD